MLNLHLYMAQRLTALIMAPLVIGHLAVMIYAVQGGLSVAEILARTQGSLAWFLFYGSFVLAVSIHAAIGMRVIMFEWLGIKGTLLSLISWGVCLLLLMLGGRAVWAVTFAGAGA
ncbi:MAG: succinate dehydrogenase [Candidatus Puniceispirillaceae bacterium]|jgi:fumarate reductase subunit C|nr:succinate dehydrogenase [Pseudomonadota bacterium]MDA0844781.1 succinate dehydrogenase [Pseudomonadota bacterium]